MKVLFTHSYFLDLDTKQKRGGKPYPPLAPLYAMALLRTNTFDVCFADLQFGAPTDIKAHLLREQPEVLVIYDDGFNYLTKMCLSNMREAVFQMIQHAAELGIPVIISSSDATDNHALYFKRGVRFLISGEAEYTLLELLQKFRTSDYSEIAGLVYEQEGQIIKNAPRAVSKNLDELPLPAWDLLDLGPYRKRWKKQTGYFSLNMVTTRGCPYKCNWCAKPIYGNRYNSHSAKRVVEEMLYLRKNAGMDHIWFADDIFGLKPGFLNDFTAAIKESGLSIPFKIQSRADLMSNATHVDLLTSAGCTEVWLGVESGSQRILDDMEKGVTLAQIKTATHLLKSHGIRVGFFMQYGYIGETLEDIKLSLALISELEPDDLGISVSYPLPGTSFYERVKGQITGVQNWAESDDLLHLFKGTYSQEFYKVLQKYTHYRFRTHQAMRGMRNIEFERSSFLLPYYFFRKKTLERRLLNNFSMRSEGAFLL